MPTDELLVLVGQAKEGNAAAFADLLLAVQRDVRIEIAMYAGSSVMLDAATNETWALCYRSLTLCPASGNVTAWMQHQAVTVMRRRVDEALSVAKQAGDTINLRILESSRAALLGEKKSQLGGVERVAQRFLGLSPGVQGLLNQRYGLRQRVMDLAEASGHGPEQIACALYAARAALDWQDAPTKRGAPAFEFLTERVLDGDQSADQARLASLIDAHADLALAFVRQVRLDLVLRALLLPTTREEMRALVARLGVVDTTSKIIIGRGALKRVAPEAASKPSGQLKSMARRSGDALRQAQRQPSGPRRQAGPMDGQARRAPGFPASLLIPGALIVAAIGAAVLVWNSSASRPRAPAVRTAAVGESDGQQGDIGGTRPGAPGQAAPGAPRDGGAVTGRAVAIAADPIKPVAGTQRVGPAANAGATSAPTPPSTPAVASTQVDTAVAKGPTAPGGETAVHPSAVLVSSSQTGSRPEALIDGSGLSLKNGKWVHSNDKWAGAGSMWNSEYDHAGSLGQLTARFDLGAARHVTGILIWNYNEKDWSHRGARNIEVSTSLDGVTFSKATGFTLRQASGADGEEAQTIPLPAAVEARYISILFLSNHSAEPTSGLSEVAVLVTDPAATDKVLK